MPNGYSPQDKIKAGLAAISGIVNNSAISETIGLTAGGSLNFRVDLEVSGVTQVGTLTVKLQHKSPLQSTWDDLAGANASTTITANGTVSLTQNVQVAADQPNMPLRKAVRVVITTTNAGDAVTIDKVWVSQEL